MNCRHCQREIPPEDIAHEISRLLGLAREAAAPRGPGDRQGLVNWLTAWRAQRGVTDADRPLKNRSTEQLWKMYEQATADSGTTYRLGRRWKK
jgi:hypothetical protein